MAQAQEEDKKFTNKPRYKTKQEREEEAINKFLNEND
jgi:hypothetical protein